MTSTRLSILLSAAAALPLAAQTNICTASPAGAGCGPTLSVQFTPLGTAGNNTIRLGALGLHPASHGLMIWGVTPQNLPLGNGCSLLTEYLYGHLIHTDDSGAWDWSRSWPNSIQGAFYIQVGSFAFDANGAFDLRVTNCELATCTW